jgi:hypothetical protein
MAADSPYGEFYDFYNFSPEYIKYTPVQRDCIHTVSVGTHANDETLLEVRCCKQAVKKRLCAHNHLQTCHYTQISVEKLSHLSIFALDRAE